MLSSRWVFLLLAFLFAACQRQEIKTLNLKNQSWSLSSLNDSIRIDSVSPSDVHLALMAANVIPDPHFRDNEKQVRWVGETDWRFQSEFDVPAQMLNQQVVNLVFEGLDTYARVWLNDSLILSADNMFRRWTIPVGEILNPKNNHLQIQFLSPIPVNSTKQSAYGIPLPEIRGFSRKAPYQFGWDWGPRLVTMGVWKPAYLQAWSHFHLADVFVNQLEVSDSVAQLLISSTIESQGNDQVEVNLYVDDKLASTKSFTLHPGTNTIELPLTSYEPKLWFPNGMGDPNLTHFRVEVSHGDRVESISVTTGIRKVELVRQEDREGASFGFHINNRKVYIKGANYIPQDNFPSRVTRAQTRELLVMAQQSNINMLRVWGGGIYESDDFYALCDSLGIMLWQDFMFAGTVYPGGEEFLQNVAAEAQQQVIRLRNHPSIVLWCGNNEIDEAWHNWGWQKSLGYSTEDSSRLWNDYNYLFEDLLPTIVHQNMPGIDYVPSSPANGWGRAEAYQRGDVHYWGVWWGAEPFEKYNQKVGRFVSEYGFQGMPHLNTIHSFTHPSDRQLWSQVMATHQKHPRGRELINEYMARDYRIPDGFNNYVYVSQLLQARGIQTAIEAHRRAKPYNQGTLYWQLNDCWPVTSWSGIDSQHRWKALQYAIKNAYDRFLISYTQQNDTLNIWMIGDCLIDRNPELTWHLITFNGDTLASGHNTFFLPTDSSVIATKLAISQLLPDSQLKNNVVLTATANHYNQQLTQANHYFVAPKDLNLPYQPNIQLTASHNLQSTPNTWQLTITTTQLAKNIWLQSTTDGHFSDNYFDLLPGQQRTLTFTPKNQATTPNQPSPEPHFTCTSLGQIHLPG